MRRLLLLGCLLAGVIPAAAQTPNQSGVLGLPAPGTDDAASFGEMIAAFERTPDRVISEVAGRPVTWGDLADSIRGMPNIVAGMPAKQLYELAAVHVMQQKALVARAEKEGLVKDPVIQRRARAASEEVLAAEILRRSMAPNITEAALRKVYDQAIAHGMTSVQVRPRVIMVDSEEDAAGLIRKLAAGGDFAELATRYSKDGSAADGGDLGFVRREMLAPELASVAFALGIGEVTSFPIKSGGFWFVMKVEGRGQRAVPPFEDVRADIANDIIHAGVAGLREAALRETPMKIYGQAIGARSIGARAVAGN